MTDHDGKSPNLKADNLRIESLKNEHLAGIMNFTDRWIGSGYFSREELDEVLSASVLNGESVSFVAFSEDEIAAIRLSFAPGKWSHLIKKGKTYDLWPCLPEEMAYFKSLFVAEDFAGKGLGQILSQRSEDAMKAVGAKAILCHSWKESPNNSSLRYLNKFGFRPVKEHEKFWFDIDYECIRCTPQRCVCTALEMVKEIT